MVPQVPPAPAPVTVPPADPSNRLRFLEIRLQCLNMMTQGEERDKLLMALYESMDRMDV
jgi:hypothetical protein